MITTKQRAYLRSLASSLNASMQIGKDGIKDVSLKQIEDMLNANELVKIKVLKTCDESVKNILNEVVLKTGCEPVQAIGGVFVIYRKSLRKDIKHISLED